MNMYHKQLKSVAIFVIYLLINNCYVFSSDLTRIEYPAPLVWYTFDEVVNDSVYDQSANNINAGFSGTVYAEPGELVFDDAGYLDIEEDVVLSGVGDFSLAFKVSIKNLDYLNTMFFFDNDVGGGPTHYKCGYNTRDNYFFVFKEESTYYMIDYEISDTSYNDIVFVYKGTLASIYFNGTLIEDNLKVPPRSLISGRRMIGENLIGSLTEFKYYNSALNNYQVNTVFEADTIHPSIPQNLNATAIANNKINLEWDASFDSIGVAGYEIYRDSVLVGITESNSYSDSGLVSDSTYVYNVQAFDHTGNISGFSDLDSAHVCSIIDLEYLELEYNVCPGDTIALEALLTDKDYNYQWQVREQRNWEDLTDSEYYKNTKSSRLLVQGIKAELIPRKYRLGVENRCMTEYFDYISITQNFSHSMSGVVYAGSDVLDLGMVYVYKVGDSGIARIVDSSLVIDGYYYLLNICQGEYKLKAVPLGSASNVYSERFYENGNNIEEATRLLVDKDIIHVTMSLVPKTLYISKANSSLVNIYPTVVKNELNIEIPENSITNTEVVISNVLGNTVYSSELPANENKMRISLWYLEPGIYNIFFKTESNVLRIQKIIVL